MGSPGLPGNPICQPFLLNPFTFILQRKSLGLTLTAIGPAPIIPYWIMPMGILVYLRASRLPFLTGSLLPAAAALAYLTDHAWNCLVFGLPCPWQCGPCAWPSAPPPRTRSLSPSQALTIQTHFLTGLTLTLALLYAAWWR